MSNANISIETINLRLPAGFETRGNAIAREVVKHLSQLPFSHSYSASTLDLPRLHLSGTESNQQVARQIASSFQQQLTQIQRQGK